MFDRLKILKDKNFVPKIIYDIGAYQGEWTTECKKIFPDSAYYMFEANIDKKSQIPLAYFEVLSDKDDKEVKYYKTKELCSTGNSLYRENTKFFRDDNIEIETRKTRTLDSLIHEHKLPPPDFIKIDTQGSELDIINGATTTLQNVQILLLEISLHEYNKNGPLFAEVIATMKKYKFVLFDIVDVHYINNTLVQIDGLFCKEDSKFCVTNY